MEDCAYSAKLLYTKLSPPAVHGLIPRVGKKKLLEKLAKYGLDEQKIEEYRQEDGTYAIPFPHGYLLIIRPERRWQSLKTLWGVDFMRELLHEFAKWLRCERGYDAETVKTLLYKKWDGSYPDSLLGDDIIVDIENFLYDMAQFAVEKVFGKNIDYDSRFLILIIPYGSYEDYSSVYVLEMKTKTVLASLEEKTWRFSPDVIEEDLEDLIVQLEEAKNLLAVKLIADS